MVIWQQRNHNKNGIWWVYVSNDYYSCLESSRLWIELSKQLRRYVASYETRSCVHWFFFSLLWCEVIEENNTEKYHRTVFRLKEDIYPYLYIYIHIERVSILPIRPSLKYFTLYKVFINATKHYDNKKRASTLCCRKNQLRNLM